MAELQEMEKEATVTEQQDQPVTLGQVLQAARVAKELSLQDVSDNLRFSVKQISALENGQYDLLPDAMITRGFIRNYARLLELDAEPLLASYRQSVASETDRGITVRSSMRPVQLTKESLPWLKYMLASILVLLFLLAWLFYVDYMPKAPAVAVDKAPEVAAEAAPVAEPLPEIALPAAQRETESAVSVPDLQADPQAALNTAAQPATNAADVKQPLGTVTQAELKPLAPSIVPSQPPAAASPAKPADKTVTMVFTAKTWVSVTDKSGKVVFEKMTRSGDQETINAVPPLNVVIGNASGTKLNFGGKDIDLAPNTRDNVARITLE